MTEMTGPQRYLKQKKYVLRAVWGLGLSVWAYSLCAVFGLFAVFGAALPGCDNGPSQATAQQIRAAGREGRCIVRCTENSQAGCYAHTARKYGVDTKQGGMCTEATTEAVSATEPDCNTPTAGGLECTEISLQQYLSETGQAP